MDPVEGLETGAAFSLLVLVPSLRSRKHAQQSSAPSEGSVLQLTSSKGGSSTKKIMCECSPGSVVTPEHLHNYINDWLILADIEMLSSSI